MDSFLKFAFRLVIEKHKLEQNILLLFQSRNFDFGFGFSGKNYIKIH